MTRVRHLLARLTDLITTAPLDLGLPEPVPAREVEAMIERAKARECVADSWDAHVDSALAVANSPWLLTDEDLLGLTAHVDLAPSRPHEPSAVERGAA